MCPFCGEGANLGVTEEFRDDCYTVKCYMCGACGGTSNHKARAIENWNRRHLEDELGRKGEAGVSEESVVMGSPTEETCGDCKYYWRRPEAVGCSADPRFVISGETPACPYFGRRSEA